MKIRITYFIALAIFGFFTACEEGDETTKDAIACFDYSPKTDLNNGDEITFTNCSEDATTYLWDFGDSNTSTEENPKHTYEQAGNYNVKLTASNESYSDTTTQEIIINSEKANYFIYDDNEYELGHGYYVLETGENAGKFMLYLTTPDLIINSSGNFEGTGNFLAFEFEKNSSTELIELPTGEFTVTENYDNFLYLDYDGDEELFTTIVNGTFNIEKINDTYSIDFNCNSESGESIIGNLNNSLIELDLN